MRALQIIQSAWRCTVEEQDDPAVWIVHAMAGKGASVDVLLRGNAVGYAVEGQDASGLRFGGKTQPHPARIDRDVAGLITKGVKVCAVEEDLHERGIDPKQLVTGVRVVGRAAAPGMMTEYDQVWGW